jgi:Ca2+-transporting ATPase
LTIFITGLLLFVPVLTAFFDFALLSSNQLLLAILVGFVSVIWYEIVKLYKRTKKD